MLFVNFNFSGHAARLRLKGKIMLRARLSQSDRVSDKLINKTILVAMWVYDNRFLYLFRYPLEDRLRWREFFLSLSQIGHFHRRIVPGYFWHRPHTSRV